VESTHTGTRVRTTISIVERRDTLTAA